VGAPPGYVGYEEGGQLTERVRRRPYSVVLLDEIEKAHPDMFNILLQVLEDGRLTDSFGRKVDFRNTVLIMTSNLGADLVKRAGALGFKQNAEETNYESIKTQLLDEVKRAFKPEFINRLDEVVVFHPLSKEHLLHIVDLEIRSVESRLKEQNITIEVTPEARELLVEKGYDPVFGARPLRRVIQRFVEDPLAEEVIAKRVLAGSMVRLIRKDDGITFESTHAVRDSAQTK
jgi:ATP-dependent Clp protease ATP-binding subunit ClpC